MTTRTRPIEKFAAATAKCTPEAAVYGKCITANYQNVSKDMCAKEFLTLKDCYLRAAGKKASMLYRVSPDV